MDSIDGGLLLLRLVVGVVFVAHGLNHAFGGGKLAGTARWFGGLGMRPPMLHAVLSVAVEIGAGLLLAVGLLTPLAAGALIGVSAVAAVTAHRPNGFFVFRDGYEYVLVLAVVCVVVSWTGPGATSLDVAVGLDALFTPAWRLGIALLVGLGGAALLLVASWRPAPASTRVG